MSSQYQVKKITSLSSRNTGIEFSARAVSRFLKFRAFLFHSLTFLWHVILNVYTVRGVAEIFQKRVDVIAQTCGLGIQYITFWNQFIQQTYFAACLLEDLLSFTPENRYLALKNVLKRTLPFVFASVVVPLSFMVVINFWPIYSTYPSIIDEFDVTASYFPIWVNHGLHTTIVMLVIIEKFLVYRNYPNKIWGFTGICTVVWSYTGTIVLLHFISGIWPYPILKSMNSLQLIAFMTCNSIFAFFIFVLGEAINKKIWGSKVCDQPHLKSS